MNQSHQTYSRILAVAPSSKGLGFAVLDGNRKLVDWGVKYVAGDKNALSLANVKKLIEDYHPSVLVIESYSAKGSRRSKRIRALGREMIDLAKSLNLPVEEFSRDEIKRGFFGDGKGSKDDMAAIVAKAFPEELALRLPPRRRLWTSEDYRMGIFDAVALAMTLRVAGNTGQPQWAAPNS